MASLKNSIAIGFGLILAICLVVVLVTVRAPYRLSGRGVLQPQIIWRLETTGGGNLSGTLTDSRTGANRAYQIFPFERGDVAGFTLRPGFEPGTSVRAGDTLGHIRSARLEQDLKRLETQLQVAEAQLASVEAGTKPERIAQAREELALAEEGARLADIQYERQRDLLPGGAISQNDLDIAQNTRELARIQVRVAKSALAVALAGEKPEDRALARTEITALRQQLAVLRRQQAGYALTVPISGVVYPASETAWIAVADTQARVLFAEFSPDAIAFVRSGQEVHFGLPGSNPEGRGSIYSVQPGLVATGAASLRIRVDSVREAGGIPGDFPLDVSVVVDTLPLYQYIWRLLNRPRYR